MRYRKAEAISEIAGRKILCVGLVPACWAVELNAMYAPGAITWESVESARDLLGSITSRIPYALMVFPEDPEKGPDFSIRSAQRIVKGLPVAIIGPSASIPHTGKQLLLSPENPGRQLRKFREWMTHLDVESKDLAQRRALQSTRHLKVALRHEIAQSGRVRHPDFSGYRRQLYDIVDRLEAVQESLQIIRKQDELENDPLWQAYKVL